MLNEPMLVEGEEICRIDRKVPGAKIELIFVLHYRSKKYEATITAVDEQGKRLVRQRLFNRLYNPDINAWAGTLVDAINKHFSCGFPGYLQKVLREILPSQAVTPTITAVPVAPAPSELVVTEPLEVAPAIPVHTPEPVVTESLEVPTTDLELMPEPLTAEDLWEARANTLNPTEDIVTLLRVCKEAKGLAVYLRVEMGSIPPAEEFTGVQTVSEISDWLRKFTMAADVAQRLGMKQPGPYDLVRRWTEMFTEPLRQFQARVA